jgi:protein O-GlcNAc transferase
LPQAGFVFCCFNSHWKITEPLFDIWMRLLAAIPGSVLWLIAEDEASGRNLRAQATARGIVPGRLVFAAKQENAAHLARHALADLFLDTLSCNAHTTASDALWAGLPLLTCAGQGFAARVGASLLHAVGLDELVTVDLEGYEKLALQLAWDAPRLHGLRQSLKEKRAGHPLFDSERFRRHIEAAYVRMVEIATSGAPPQSFAVEAQPHG